MVDSCIPKCKLMAASHGGGSWSTAARPNVSGPPDQHPKDSRRACRSANILVVQAGVQAAELQRGELTAELDAAQAAVVDRDASIAQLDKQVARGATEVAAERGRTAELCDELQATSLKLQGQIDQVRALLRLPPHNTYLADCVSDTVVPPRASQPTWRRGVSAC